MMDNAIHQYTPVVVERFWKKVEKGEGCWIWTGAAGSEGDYGNYRAGRRFVSAHRFAYEISVGPIPSGLEIDHLCRVTLCVNPAHMEPVTGEENRRRKYAAIVRCAHGHPYDEANTYIRKSGGRDCRACIRVRVRNYIERRRKAA
jgi:hypothetical protein